MLALCEAAFGDRLAQALGNAVAVGVGCADVLGFHGGWPSFCCLRSPRRPNGARAAQQRLSLNTEALGSLVFTWTEESQDVPVSTTVGGYGSEPAPASALVLPNTSEMLLTTRTPGGTTTSRLLRMRAAWTVTSRWAKTAERMSRTALPIRI